jgi:hypothetical protein
MASNKIETSTTTPMWFWIASVLGLGWNLFGVYQFFGSLSATPESLQAKGMTAEQAAVMLGYPTWMTIAFAIGVVAGSIGCILLLVKNSQSIFIFWASLIAYIILYIGDVTQGVFCGFGHTTNRRAIDSGLNRRCIVVDVIFF